MSRETEYFSMYSLMSIRTMFFSLVEQGFRQRLGQFRLAHAGGTQEQEGADGTVGVLDTGTAAEDGLADAVDRFVLADDSLVEDVVQVQQLLPFALHELCHGNAGPAFDDEGDLAVGDTVTQQAALLALVGDVFFLRQLLFQLRQLAVFQLGGLFQVVFPFRLFHLGVGRFDVLTELLHLFNGVLFILPLSLLGVELLPHIGQFLLDGRQTFLTAAGRLPSGGQLLQSRAG